jgi:hypothetical protein
MKIPAPSRLVSGVLGVFDEDRSLYSELDGFVVNGPPGAWTVKGDDKRNIKATFDQLEGKATALIEKRQSGMSAH